MNRDSASLVAISIVALFSVMTPGVAMAWTHHGSVASGTQIDALPGPDDTLHLVSDRYYRFDENGNVEVDEAVGDGAQNSMYFPPAIDVEDDGTVHLVTREAGSPQGGYHLRYRKRSPDAQWATDYIFEEPVPRNYVVGVGNDGAGNTHLLSTVVGGNVWGDVNIYDEMGGDAFLQGTMGSVWRADTDARMRAVNGTVYVVIGKNDGSGEASFTWGSGGDGLVEQLQTNRQVHTGGDGRQGFPDIYIDSGENAHFVYGSQTGQVLYNRYDASKQRVFDNDIQVLNGLGTWHLSTGIGAVGASDDGQTIVVVGLLSDGSQAATNSEMMWTYSEDGGESWSPQESLGVFTSGGEGRLRPRLMAIGNTFYMFYNENGVSGISLMTKEIGTGEPATGDDEEEVEPDPAQLRALRTDGIDLGADLSAFGAGEVIGLDGNDWRGLDGATFEGTTVEAALRWSPDRLYLGLEVDQSEHHNDHGAEDLWMGDSLQVGFDTGNAGGTSYDAINHHEMGFALSNSDAISHRFHGPSQATDDWDFLVEREGTTTRYQVHLEPEALGLSAFDAEQRMGFTFLVNVADASGRLGWLELTPGMGATKSPQDFAQLELADEYDDAVPQEDSDADEEQDDSGSQEQDTEEQDTGNQQSQEQDSPDPSGDDTEAGDSSTDEQSDDASPDPDAQPQAENDVQAEESSCSASGATPTGDGLLIWMVLFLFALLRWRPANE